MRKSTVILIAVIYVVAVIAISFFGLKAKVYNEEIPVEYIECYNTEDSDKGIRIADYEKADGTIIMRIHVEWSGVGQIVGGEGEGTFLQILARVMPDDATNNTVSYVYDKDNTCVSFYTDENTGKETGLVFFLEADSMLEVTIVSNDGRNISLKIIISCGT